MQAAGWEMRVGVRSSKKQNQVNGDGQECPPHTGLVITLQDASRF
jgi:hypothetical protein